MKNWSHSAKRILKRLSLLILTLFFTSTWVYSQEISLGEKQKDGSVLVVIDGVQYRAFPLEALRQLAEQKIELDGLRLENAKLIKRLQNQDQIKDLLTKQIALLEQDRQNFRDETSSLRQSFLDVSENMKNLEQIVSQVSRRPSWWNSLAGKLTLIGIQGAVSYSSSRLAK